MIQHVDQDLYGAYAVARRRRRRGPPAADLAALPDVGPSPRCATCSTPSSGGSSAASRSSSGGATCATEETEATAGPGRRGGARDQRCGRQYRRRREEALRRLPRARPRRGRPARLLRPRRPAAEVPRHRGRGLQQFGETASIMWPVHGWVFIIYVVVAFFLSRRARLDARFTLLALVAGLVPLLIFWVERRVVQRMRVEHPELRPRRSAGTRDDRVRPGRRRRPRRGRGRHAPRPLRA